VLTVKQPVQLVLTATSTNLIVGQSSTVTVKTSDPAPAGGLVVSLSGGGTGAGTYPASVTIPASGTSATFVFNATADGSYSITANAPNRVQGSISFAIAPQITITSFTPTSGPAGSAVTINGTAFDPVGGNNTVRFNGEPAVIVNAAATVLNVIVPLKATTGPISVANTRGTATSATPFTVQERESFNITIAPAAIQVPMGGNGGSRIKLISTGLNAYPYGATLSASGLPAGVTAVFDRPMVSLNQDAILTLTVQGTVAAGNYPVTVTGTGLSGMTTVGRPQTLTLTVLAAGSTTVSGRVLQADDGAPFVGARIRLSTAQAFTDDTGTYRFVNPPVTGDQVLLIDGAPKNTAAFEYPSAIPMPVMILSGQDNKALTAYIQKVDATKFTTIVPGQAATVTNADIPNYSLNIPSGATLFGWDNTAITKVSVRLVPVDRLPIKPIPAGVTTRNVYLYYFFREGGANPKNAAGAVQPIPVTMANDIDALPGDQIELWYYDESATPDVNSNQWRVMGMGTVSADGKSIVSNPGVGIPKFCCGAGFPRQRDAGGDPGAEGGNGEGPALPNGPDPSPAPDPSPSGGSSSSSPDEQPTSCDPVDFASGNALAFFPRAFGMSTLMSINPNCRYRSTDGRIGLFGRGMSFSYDWFAEQFSNAVRVTNPSGVRFLLSLEADGKYRSRSGRSRSIEMEVTPTASGRTLRFADGKQYDFDTLGRLSVMRDLNNNAIRFTLNGTGFPASMTDAAGRVYTFTLTGSSPNVNITRITDPEGRFVQFDYDANRRLIRYTDQGGGVTQLEYDLSNRISKVTDPRLAVKTIEYDSAGRAVREVLPETAEERYAYTTVERTVTETRRTDPNGNVTTYRFNGLGFLSSTTDALGRVSKIERDPVTNLVTKRIDPAGRVTQYFYNSRGDLIRTIDADNKETLIDYDPRFRKPTRTQNALSNVTTMVYDAKGNLTSLTNAQNETTTFAYTFRGLLQSVTDPLGRVKRFDYDPEGNLLSSTNTANETVTRTYDTKNRLTTLTDALGRLTQFGYDTLDRVNEVRDAANGLTKYAFDANDNRVSVADPKNNPVERNVYDLRNRLKTRTDAKNLNTSYEYDGVGNIVRMTDRKAQLTTYTYDALNRVTQISDRDGRVTSYSYDLAGNLARISDSLSGEMLMSYDNLDRLTEVVTAQGTVGYTYDAIGRRLTRTITGGDVTSYTYDKANRLKTVTLRSKTAIYNYDIAGRLTDKTLPNGLKAVYQYDAADRVTSIAYTRPNNTVMESVTYSYDPGGQRINKTEGQVPPQDTGFAATYDEANRLATITIAGEVFTLSYDANGNLTTKNGPVSGITTYTWSARNQLLSLSGRNGTASFRYDALGRRTEKTVNASTTGFLYDGAQAIAELRGGAVDTVYHNGLAIDEVLARYGSSGNKTLLTDALMSVIAQANDAQGVDNYYAYSAYGEVAVLGPDGGNSLQYTGRENDGTGLYFYRARYYDPVLKRFVSEDPVGIEAGLNLFSYVDNSPLNFIDPTGEAPWPSDPNSSSASGSATGSCAGPGKECKNCEKLLKVARTACLIWCLAVGKRPPPEPQPPPPPRRESPSPPKNRRRRSVKGLIGRLVARIENLGRQRDVNFR
jgi:RHS repeat-associated protein